MSPRDREAGSDFPSLWSWRPPEGQPAALGEASARLPGAMSASSPCQEAGGAGREGGRGPHEFTRTRLTKPVPVRTLEGRGHPVRDSVCTPSVHPVTLSHLLPKPRQPWFQQAKLLSTRTQSKRHQPPWSTVPRDPQMSPGDTVGRRGGSLLAPHVGAQPPAPRLHCSQASLACWPPPLRPLRALVLSLGPGIWRGTGRRLPCPPGCGRGEGVGRNGA